MATSQPMSFQATLLNISHHHVTPDQCGLTSHVDRLWINNTLKAYMLCD